MFGPYYRRIDPPDVIQKIQESGELWGSSPRNYFTTDFLKVKAIEGPLPADQRGFEFETDVAPDVGSPSGQGYWSNGREGVRIEDGYAKIKVHVRKIQLQ